MEIISLDPLTDSAKYSPDLVAPYSVILGHPSQLRALFLMMVQEVHVKIH